MGKRGPLGLSDAERRLRGLKPRNRPKTAAVTRLQMPGELDGDAAELWRRVVPPLVHAGQLTQVDVPALRDMCICWARLQECERRIAADGPVIVGYRNDLSRHPAVLVARGYRSDFARWAARFGLTIADRHRLPEGDDPGAETPAEALQRMVTERIAVPSWPMTEEQWDALAEEDDDA